MNLPTDMVDVELMTWIVKGNLHVQRRSHHGVHGIHPMEQKMTHFPSLRCKIEAYKDDHEMRKSNNGVILSSSQPLQLHTLTQEKRTPGKIRARLSNKARYNPMKIIRPNTPDLPVTNMDMMDSYKGNVPLSVRACYRFGTDVSALQGICSASFTQESDWMDEDWKIQKPVGGTNLMSDWDLPLPQYSPQL